MSENRIMAEFGKCGSLHKFSRRFHSLERSQKERALEAIRNGTEPDKALKLARKMK